MKVEQYGNYVVLDGHNVDEKTLDEAKGFLKESVQDSMRAEGIAVMQDTDKFIVNETYVDAEGRLNTWIGSPVTTLGYKILGAGENEDTDTQSDKQE